MTKKTMWKVITLLSVIIIAIAVDLVSKYVLDARLVLDGNEVSAIPHLIDFKLVHNDGAAWGILAGKQAFLIFLAVVFIAIFVWYYIKEKNKTWLLTISVGLLVAGTVGNLFDRIFFGYVRDFLMFDFWKSFPVFNFADVLLCIGVVLFAIYLIVYFVKNKKKVNPEDENGKES